VDETISILVWANVPGAFALMDDIAETLGTLKFPRLNFSLRIKFSGMSTKLFGLRIPSGTLLTLLSNYSLETAS